MKKNTGITAIARACGVSAMTVSRALRRNHCVNQATRRKILAAAAQLSYQPDGRMGRPRRQSGNIRQPARIIVEANLGGANLYHACLLGAIERALAEHECNCLLRTYDGTYDNFVWLCDVLRSDPSLPTMIVGYFPLEKLRTLLQLAPDALLVDYTENPRLACPYDSLGFDNIEAARMAVRHLLETGRRRILLMKGHADHSFSTDIEKGYRDILDISGIEFDDHLVVAADFTADGAYKRALDIIGGGLKFDAVFTNDEMALGIMRALGEKGILIPEHVAIAGCDGLSFGRFIKPALTTILLDHNELGRMAADHILARKRKGPPLRIRLVPKLEVRESTIGKIGKDTKQ